MITIEEGNKEIMPWIKVEITTGRFPFEWWYEVSVYDPDHEIEGRKVPCWTHYLEKDGGGFGFWRVMRKAGEVLQVTWMEVWEEQKKKWDTGGPWVCEQHPDKPFPHEDCIGPGVPPQDKE